MILAVDFDGVLHDENPDPGRKLGRPLPGAVETMCDWLEAGHTLIIFSVWGFGSGERAIEAWCSYFNVPFHEITNVKPNADLFIDDRAVRFESWPQVAEFVSP